jgi:hypothetical protein
MKALIVILIIVCFVYGARFLVSYYGGFKEKIPQTQTASRRLGERIRRALLQPSVSLRSRGAGPLPGSNWSDLSQIRKDPRLAWIELDYVVMVSQQDPGRPNRFFKRSNSESRHLRLTRALALCTSESKRWKKLTNKSCLNEVPFRRESSVRLYRETGICRRATTSESLPGSQPVLSAGRHFFAGFLNAGVLCSDNFPNQKQHVYGSDFCLPKM